MNELEVIRGIKKAFDRPFPGVIRGIGDDCAVVRIGGKTVLVTTDALLEGVHFLPQTMPPYPLGRKALAVNLSDIAAMGGEPLFAFLTLGLPKPVPRGFLSSFLKGFKKEADRFKVALLGGDTLFSPGGISIGITLVGLASRHIPYRSRARAGDRIFVSGFLGDSAAGLELLKREGGQKIKIPREIRTVLIKAHQLPEPRLSLGRFLVRRRYVRAMIDLSDGLASDLRQICQASGVGARLDLARLPLSAALLKTAAALERDPFGLALQGGEDYQLLFTVPKTNAALMEKAAWTALRQKLFDIGEIIPGRKIYLGTPHAVEELRVYGYDHFQSH
jgi:thiamine-monophosphate kinase